MPRIVVIGSSGSGKSTLTEKLANKLEIPWVQLDALNWLPDWIERGADEFVSLVDQNTPPIFELNHPRQSEAMLNQLDVFKDVS